MANPISAWHQIPKDDAWKQVTLRSVNAMGQNLWIRCDHCCHDLVINAVVFSERSGVDLDSPLLGVSLKLKCSKCGQRKSYCRPEPYGIHQRKA
jgi:hypothetical protein